MMLHIPNVLTKAQASAMRERLLASAEWVDGRATVGPQGAQVKHNAQLDDASALRHELAGQVLAALRGSKLLMAAALPARILTPLFNCYRGGGDYGTHVDGAVLHELSGQLIRSDLSCTLFLCEPDTYTGGELVVEDTYGEHGAKLPAGDMVLYPSSSLHHVTPVAEGERLAAFFWIQSMVRDSSHRRLLLELDTAITRLTDSKADRASVVQLTGIYHNLLREWADV